MKKLVVGAFVVGGCLMANAAGAENAADEFDMLAFENRKGLTMSGYAGTTTLTDFPVLVRLSSGVPEEFDPADAGENGAELRFFTDTGVLLPHEIDEWNPAGESLIWVKVPELATGTKICVCWKLKAGRTVEALPAKDVWSDYAFVHHLKAPNADGVYADSTGNGFTATNSTTALNVSVAESAAVGKGLYKEGGKLCVKDYSALGVGGVFTASGWFYMDKRIGYESFFGRKLVYNSGLGWSCNMQNDNLKAFVTGSDYAVAYPTFASSVVGRWTFLTLVYDGRKITCYDLGKQFYTGSGFIAAADWASELSVGSTVNGRLDEIRLRKSASTADRVKAEYDTVASDAFATWTDPPVFFAAVPATAAWFGDPVRVHPDRVCNAQGEILVEGKDYEVSWSGSTNGVGRAYLTITGIGAYESVASVTYSYDVESSYGTGSVFFASPTGRDDADCRTFETAGTIRRAVTLLPAGTSWDNPSVVVLRSGTVENPAIYDLSEATGTVAAQYNYAYGTTYLNNLGKNYNIIRSEVDDPRTVRIVGGAKTGNQLRFAAVPGNQIRFSGMTFENWTLSDTSGAVFSSSYGNMSPLYTNCVFVGNYAKGGAAVRGGTVRNCRFLGNSAGSDGGVIYPGNNGVAVYDSTFTSNTTSCIRNANAGSRVERCQFRSNSGGVCCNLSGAVGAMVECDFFDNAGGCANGYQNGSTIRRWEVSDCNFISNLSYGVRLSVCSNCTFIGNRRTNSGGAGAESSICTNCLFIGNYVTNTTTDAYNSGGAGHNSQFVRCAFTNNFVTPLDAGIGGYNATYGGGSINGGSATDCIIYGSRAPRGGAAIGADLLRCEIANCKAVYFGALSGGTKANVANTADNCLIHDCETIWPRVGAVIAGYTLINCTVVSNRQTTAQGCAIGNNCKMINTLAWDNVPYDRGMFFDWHYFTESLVTTNSTFETSMGGKTYTDFGVVASDRRPYWPDGPRRFQLKRTSVCRNAGTNYLDAAGHPKYDGGSVDLIGRPRLFGSAVDIGALEYVPNTGLMLLVR